MTRCCPPREGPIAFWSSSGVCVGCCLGEDANLAAAPLVQSLFSRPRGRWPPRECRRHVMVVGTLVPPDAARVATSVATVYTNAPKRRREAISTDLCTLLPHRPGGEARPIGAVTQAPTHTNSRSLQLGTCPHVSVYRLWGRWIRQTGCDRARRSCRLRRAVPRACLARRWFLAPSRG